MIATFQALAVALIALVPGATYQFSYERVFGAFGVSLGDRLVRFVAASAVFAAVFSGPGYVLYRQLIITGSLGRGEVGWWWVEFTCVTYVVLPLSVGLALGLLHLRGNAVVVALLGASREPRAWDYVWRQAPALVRAKLKSGRWVAGLFGTSDAGAESYASGYPEAGDLFLSLAFEVDAGSGEWRMDGEGLPVPSPDRAGLLLKWDEVEYLEVRRTGEEA